MACYTLHLATGSTLVSRSIKSRTMKGYLLAVDKLCEPRGLMSPQISVIGGRCAFITKVLDECKRWEEMPRRREPVTPEMMNYIVQWASKEHDEDSLLSVLADWLVMGEYGGFRKSEWAQDERDAKKGRFETNIDGTAKAFTINDMSFRKHNRVINNDANSVIGTKDADRVDLTWRFQKNGNNGETLPFSRNDKHPHRCFVRRALRVRARAQRLRIKQGHPIAVFRDGRGKPRYVSNKHVEHLLRFVAKKVHNVTKQKELQKWSCHSIRVGACTRLQQLGLPEHFIQSRLRWTSESWKDYLRHLPQLADTHNDIIVAMAEELASITDPKE